MVKITDFRAVIKKTISVFTLGSFLLPLGVKVFAQQFEIMSAEPVFLIEEAVQSTDNSKMTDLSFFAYNREFNLQLESNSHLKNKALGDMGEVRLLKGKIAGNKKSWARVSIVNGLMSGVIHDGKELFLIESIELAAASLAEGPQQTIKNSDTIIYRSSDIESKAGCGSMDAKGDDLSFENVFEELRATSDNLQAAAGATQQLNIAITTDPLFNQRAGGDPEARVLAQMNIVDGIFSEQVGVQLNITNIQALDQNGSLTSTDSGQLLGQFRNEVIRSRNNPGLAHLFTGRNLDGSTIGIASLGAICNERGVGLTQVTSSVNFAALIAAHEIGHNFGAPHDNQDNSRCSNTPGGFLMNPSLNGSSTFSQCSLDQMAATIARRSCLEDVVVEPAPPIDCDFRANFANGTNGFVFVDDEQTPQFSRGSSIADDLSVTVGGVDNSTVENMEGAWRRLCTASSATEATITLDAALSQSSEYEDNELSQVVIRVNGQEEVLAEIAGDGNGGFESTTGIRTFTVNLPLNAGENVIDLKCFNNAKTFSNESTRCDFESLSISTDIPPSVGSGNVLVSEDFNGNAGGFNFVGDSQTPEFSRGLVSENSGVNNSGVLAIILGGINNDDVSNMTGSWAHTFNGSGLKVLSLDANIIQSSEYEADEVSVISVNIDGQNFAIAEIVGNGNGGGSETTGFQNFTLPLNLSAGSHTVSLSCSNNKKTFVNETTFCLFDNVVIQ